MGKLMTIDEALQIARNVFAQTTGNLADHQAMQMALETLTQATKPAVKVTPKSKKNKDQDNG